MSKVVSLGNFGLDISLDKIQAIRLCGALLESDFNVYFPQEAEQVLQHLSKHFNIRYNLGLQGITILKDVSIVHEEPLTKIGPHIQAPLIFSHEMVAKCRAKWDCLRPTRFSFCGLVTKKRKMCLDSWVRSQFGRKGMFVTIKESGQRQGRLHRIYSRFVNNSTNTKQTYKNIGLCIFTSDFGRQFPIKVWDEDYYNFLLSSRFVLCPDGDFIWTYRFFESVLCGAIPIVENTCNLYNGFEYFSMSDSLDKLIYSEEVAERNFYRAKQMLTVRREKLNHHLTELLKQA